MRKVSEFFKHSCAIEYSHNEPLRALLHTRAVVFTRVGIHVRVCTQRIILITRRGYPPRPGVHVL